jgi:hypothetical protein
MVDMAMRKEPPAKRPGSPMPGQLQATYRSLQAQRHVAPPPKPSSLRRARGVDEMAPRAPVKRPSLFSSPRMHFRQAVDLAWTFAFHDQDAPEKNDIEDDMSETSESDPDVSASDWSPKKQLVMEPASFEDEEPLDPPRQLRFVDWRGSRSSP